MGRRDLKQRVASVFELPGDVMLDVARITMMGCAEMLIENHRGISEYTPERVVLGLPQGHVLIGGEGLEISTISPDQVTIKGNIRSVLYSD